MTNKIEIERTLLCDYLDKLENDGVYPYVSSATPNDFIQKMKPELIVSDEKMSNYLGFTDFAEYMSHYLLRYQGIKQAQWITQWAREMV